MITRTSHRTTLLLATFAFQIFAAQGQPGGVAGTVTPQNVGGITPLGQPGRAYPTGRDKISASPRFREAMLRLGETNQWKLGPRKYNADDQPKWNGRNETFQPHVPLGLVLLFVQFTTHFSILPCRFRSVSAFRSKLPTDLKLAGY
jgi:hypothetical protein